MGNFKGQQLVHFHFCFFSSPGRSPGRAIILPPALTSASAATSMLAKCQNGKVFTLKFLCDWRGAVRRAILSM